jgi:hypothetical protein
MAADYEAHPALSSIAATRAGDFAAKHRLSRIDNSGFPKTRPKFVANFGTNFALFAFAQNSCALHQSFKEQPNAGQRHRNPDTLSQFPEYQSCVSLSP